MLRQGELLLSASATPVGCGTFSGVYELNVRRVGDGDCVKCGAASVVETSERIHTALGIPLLRRVYESSTCTACNWWQGRAIRRPDYPRTPGARSLVWLS